MITYAAITWEVTTEPVGRVEKSGEVWSPGPLPHTVWVLDAAAPLGARVVNSKTRKELAYEHPSTPTTARGEESRKARPASKLAAMSLGFDAGLDLFSVAEDVTYVM